MSGDLRVGDAERERAAAALGDHYAAGRLEPSEYAERLDAIWTARTRRDLDVLFHDLPRLAAPQPPARRRGPVGALLSVPFGLIVVLVVGVVVITHLPIVLMVLGVVLFLKLARGSHAHRPHRSRSVGRW